MRLSPLAVLSDDEIAQIHEATLSILETCGVRLGSPRMLEFLRERGLPVDLKNQTVRFPRGVVEDAVGAVPPEIEVFNREGSHAFTIGKGKPKIAAGHNAVFWVDSQTGKTRPSTVADVEIFARICEQLDNIDMIGIPVMPQNVPDPRLSLLHGIKAVVTNSRKPVYFSTDNQKINRSAIELLRAAFAGDFERQTYGITQLSPTSPLFWEESVLDAIQDTITTGVPIAILPEPNAGISAPYTLAGLLTVNNAECLSGIAMIQLCRRGHNVMYANSWTTTDMRQGAALVGSVETSICRIAGAQLAQYYKLPCHTTAPNSDNHAHDEQNAWEKTISLLCAVAAGNDLIVNCGMFATGMTCSHEQLVMDNEIAGMARRLADGVKVSADTIARDLIMETGKSGGTFLTSDHTMRFLRSDEYFEPQVAVRGPRALWETNGAKDTSQIARELATRCAESSSAPLDEKRRKALESILQG